MSNVIINGRSAVHAGSGGMLTTVDVCKTKIGKSTVPIPYTNIAVSSDAGKTAGSVKINGNPACMQDSVFSKSTGDEPGKKKGVKSHKIKGQAEFVSGSPNVFIEGTPAVRAFEMMVSNCQNTAPMPLMQPSGAPSMGLSAGDPGERELAQGPDAYVVDVAGEGLGLIKGQVIAGEDEA